MTGSATGNRQDRGPAARRELIRRRVLDEGFARLDALAREFQVSLMTVHRDVDALEDDGWLTKVRGGATANPSALVESSVRARSAAQHPEKAAICRLAASMLHHGQTIFLDDSTTALGLVPALAAHTPLTVVTNFLPVATELGGVSDLSLHLLGGQYQARAQACFGLQTVAAIDTMHADIVFMSTTALSDGKCLHRGEDSVAVRQAFLAGAARRVLLVDHAKFGRQAPHVLCPVDTFDVIITDDGADPEDLAALRAHNTDVRVVPVDAGEPVDTDPVASGR